MKPIHPTTLFDPSLTPRNSLKRGYNYIEDISYDFLNPSESMKDILEFARKFNGKFGTPFSTSIDARFGLYIPNIKAYGKNNKNK